MNLVGLSFLLAAAAFSCSGCGVLNAILGRSCVELPLDGNLQTGVRGTVTLGPTCPVETPEEPCVEPYEADLRVECPSGADITSVRSDANGEFEVRLPPGEYRIVPLQPDANSPLPIASPVDVQVPEEGFANVQIDYDTGIR